MKLLFNSREEWMQEVEDNLGGIERRIVRITSMQVLSQGNVPLVALYLVAGVIITGRLVELIESIGTYLVPQEKQKALDARERELRVIEEFCAGHLLMVRRGRFQEDK